MREKPLLPERLAHIRLLVLDVDGVLTRGEVVYDGHGNEIKYFNVRDGLGIRMLKLAGIRVAVITGRSSAALRHRLDNLNVELLRDGVSEKVPALLEMSRETGISLEKMAYAGDDLPDLGAMARVGVAVAVADAHPLVREEADMVTAARGGAGAVRELAEAMVRAAGKWDEVLRAVSR